MAQGGGGGRLNDRPCFAVLQLHDFEKILPLADSFLCALQDEVNIMGSPNVFVAIVAITTIEAILSIIRNPALRDMRKVTENGRC